MTSRISSSSTRRLLCLVIRATGTMIPPPIPEQAHPPSAPAIPSTHSPKLHLSVPPLPLGPHPSSNAITDAIRSNHQSIHELYDQFRNIPKEDKRERQAIANELVREISVHSEAEEVVVYPVVERRGDVAERLRMEHLEVKKELHELDKMPIDDPNFPMTLNKTFTDHSAKEKAEELPDMERKLSREELRALNVEFEQIKTISPTHPHPKAPQKPAILKDAVAAGSAAVDKAYDITQDFAERRVP
ncbi:hypothetical protein HK102_013839 [Quaeritorhiza haematococci]|nr:hypothetical protein HK102_013839 [Quaeritorhiza haematococci]